MRWTSARDLLAREGVPRVLVVRLFEHEARALKRPAGGDVVDGHLPGDDAADSVLAQQPDGECLDQLTAEAAPSIGLREAVADLDVAGLVRRAVRVAVADH